MSRREPPIVEMMETFMKFPWWGNIAAGAITYIAMKWLIPLLFLNFFPQKGLFPIHKIFGQAISQFAPLALVFFGVTTILSVIWHIRRGTFFKNNAHPDAIQTMSWQDFEVLISEYYKRLGYAVEETGGGGPDGGVDLILRRDGEKTLVQCKHWKAYRIGVSVVRELYGVMADTAASKAVIVTSGEFTTDAEDFARDKPINLINGRELASMLASVMPAKTTQQVVVNGKSFPLQATTQKTAAPHNPADYAPKETPICPRCKIPMVLRTAKHGPNIGSKFWGCKNYPHCKAICEYKHI